MEALLETILQRVQLQVDLLPSIVLVDQQRQAVADLFESGDPLADLVQPVEVGVDTRELITRFGHSVDQARQRQVARSLFKPFVDRRWVNAQYTLDLKDRPIKLFFVRAL